MERVLNPRCRAADGRATIDDAVELAAWDLGWRHGRDGQTPYQEIGRLSSQAPDAMRRSALQGHGPARRDGRLVAAGRRES